MHNIQCDWYIFRLWGFFFLPLQNVKIDKTWCILQCFQLLLTQLCSLKASGTNSTFFSTAEMSLRKDLQHPLENTVLIKSCSKMYDSEQFYKSELCQKTVVNVTVNSPKGLLNMRSHGTAVAFWRAEIFQDSLSHRNKQDHTRAVCKQCRFSISVVSDKSFGLKCQK